MQHATKTLIVLKAAAWIVTMVVFLLVSVMLLKSLNGLFSGDSAVPVDVANQQSTSAGNQTKSSAGLTPSIRQFRMPDTHAYLEKVKKDQAVVKRQKEISKKMAWEASLMCGYSSDTRRCACYDPKGGKVAMEFATCRALADKGTGVVR